VLARGGRFFLEAALLRFFGARAKTLIERHFALLVSIIFVILIAGFIGVKWLF